MRIAAFGGSGYAKMQSGLRPLCIFTPPHFAVAGTLRVPLSQPQKRRIQPKRYATYPLTVVGKYCIK